jgi:diguanylate cyclase (GGDEF)-like protein
MCYNKIVILKSDYMNIKKPYILIVIFAFAFFVVSELIGFYFDYEKAKHDIYKNDNIAINNLLNAQEENLQMLANIFANDAAVIKAYKQNDPNILIEHIEPIWKKMQKEKLIYEVHFFKPPAISFVNFSNFKSIGTDVSSARKDILWVTTSFRPSTHNLMCKTYAGIRATYPITDKEHKLLGGLSLGKKIDWLPKAIKKNTHRDAFLVYTKTSVATLAPKYYKAFMKGKIAVGDYILANTTIKDINPKTIESIDFQKKIQYITLGSELYLLDQYPIYDFSKNIMGYIFVLNDTKKFYLNYLKSILLNFIIIFITAVIIYYVTKKRLGEFNQQLQKSINQLNTAQEAAKMGSYSYYIDSGRIEWSDNHYKLFGVTKENFQPSLKKFIAFVHPEDKNFVKKQLIYAIKSKKYVSFEYRIVLHTKGLLFVRSTALLIDENKGKNKLLNGTIQDISEYKKLELENLKKTQQLVEQLYTDELTKLQNRRALIRDMQNYPEAAIAIVNIKSFKNINDVFGFDVGNFVLETLSTLLLQRSKEHDLLLYRIGSDEFAILNSKLSDQYFVEFIDRVISLVENKVIYYSPKNIEININIYAGICLSKENRLACADVALSEAGKLHKDYVIYSSSENLIKEQEHNIKIINTIKDALTNDKVVAYIQAIVDADTHINKYEALVRIEDNGTLLTPDQFLEIAKKTKYYPLITKKVIEKTFSAFENREEYFSINLIAEDILNESTLAFIRKKVMDFKEKERIIFEIVESENIYQIKEVAEFIQEMQSLGVKIAIDDFGTGYSNFAYMMQLHPQYIKIDGSLIRNITTNQNAKNIVTTIIAFAKNLHCKTVAEFVHSKEVFELTKKLGVDEFQGYYFSEPKRLE